MHRNKKSFWLAALWSLWFAAVAPLPAAADQAPQPVGPQLAAPAAVDSRQLDAYTIPPLPDWADRYAGTDLGADVRFFRMKKLMTDFGISRFEAVEVQNHYRDLTAAGTPGVQAFQKALAEVKAGNLGSGVSMAKLRSAPFIVVYDLDETLYQAFYKSGARGPAWRDFAFTSRGQESYVKLRPGWERAIQRVHELGGLVLLFTARSDDVAEAAIANWTLNGKNIRQVVDGVLSKSHLVLQEKSDGDPIVTPSKDLRIFDETLERVILIDDNPRRVVQHNRQRLVKKFQADIYLEAKNSAQPAGLVTASFERTLSVVVREIEESVAYARAHARPAAATAATAAATRPAAAAGVGFAGAYLPYTMLGQAAMEALMQSGLKPEAARQYIREHPSYVETDF